MHRHLLAVFSVGLALLLVDVGCAEVIEALDDNSIRGGPGQADTVQDFSGNLLAKKSVSIEFARKAYIKFDLDGHNPDGSQPATFTIGSALSPGADFTAGVYGLLAGFVPDAGELGSDWSETVLTWDNAPANVDTITGFDNTEATLIGTISPQQGDAAGQDYSLDIPTLGDFLQSGDTVTLFLIVNDQSESSPSMLFASSEHFGTFGPQLNFSAVPEPSTLTMLTFMALAVAFAVRRRRAG